MIFDFYISFINFFIGHFAFVLFTDDDDQIFLKDSRCHDLVFNCSFRTFFFHGMHQLCQIFSLDNFTILARKFVIRMLNTTQKREASFCVYIS